MTHYQPFVAFKCDEVINKRGHNVSVRVSGWTAEAEANNASADYGNTFYHDPETKVIHCRVVGSNDFQVVAHGIKTKKAAVEWMTSQEGHKAMYAVINAQREVLKAQFEASRIKIAAIKAAKNQETPSVTEEVNAFEVNQIVEVINTGKLGMIEMVSHVDNKAQYLVNDKWYAEEDLSEVDSKAHKVYALIESSSLEAELKELHNRVTVEGYSPIEACKRAVIIVNKIAAMNAGDMTVITKAYDYLIKTIRTQILFSAKESQNLINTPVFDIPKPLQDLAAEIATYNK